jgi:hypothetical protein
VLGILTFFGDYWKPLGCALLLALAFSGGWYIKGEIDAVRASRLQETVQQSVITAQQSATATEHHNQQLTEETSHALQDRLTAIDREFAADLGGVQQPAAAAYDNLSGIAGGQSGYSCPAGGAGLSRENKEFLINFAKAADDQTARLIACQNFLRSHGQAD